MRFFFTIYLIFGLMIGGLLHDGFAGRFPWDAKAILSLLGMHVLAIGFGVLLAIYAKQKHGKTPGVISPKAWVLGICISYVVGLVGVLVALTVKK